METGILLIDCPDRRGLVASIAQFLYEHGANILHSDQHQDNETGRFFMRIEWALEGFDLTEKSFVEQFGSIAESFQMQWRLEFSSRRPRIAIFVSRDQHCLVDLLYRIQIEELKGDVALIISNHPDAKAIASFHGIPFHEIPITK